MSNLTDSQWNKINFLFPKAKKVGRSALNSRMVLNAILWILRSGARWRDLPSRYGNWNSIYHKFRLWCKLGIFENILKIINQSADDSSRGGKNTKIHVLVNERMQMLNVVLTGGQVHDSEKAIELFERITLKGKTVLADKAFSSEKIREYIEKEGGQVCIPDKSNSKINHDFDKEMYKKRSIVERFFQRIKNFRHSSLRQIS